MHFEFPQFPAVVPVLVGPLNALVAAAPGILFALFGLAITLFKPATAKRLLQLVWSQKIVVVPTLALVVALFYAWSTLFPSKVSAVSAAVGFDKASWPAFRGSMDRRAYVPTHFATGKPIEDPAHGNINWSFTDGKIKTFYGSPAVVGNRVYITGARYEYFNDVGGIYSIDVDTGQLVWAFHGDKYRSTFSSPAISGKYLVVGEGLHETKDSRVFCLDIEQSEKKRQGVKLWDFRTNSHMESSPCIDGDRTIIGAGDDGVLCFALAPGSDGKAKKLWQLEGKDFPDCESAPVVHEGKLYFGLGRVVHAFFCADPKTGSILWRVDTPYPTGSGSIANGKIYVPMGIGDFVNDAASLRTIKQKELEEQHKSSAEIEAELAAIKDVGELWCIDLETHKVDWKFALPATSLGTAAVDGERIYVGSRDGNLYCVSAAGTLINKFNAHGPIVSSPAVGDRHVYVLTSSGTLFCLDKATLAQVWSTTVGGETFSSPTVANGHVYVGTNNGGFLSIGEPGREKAEALWPGPLGGKAGAIDGSIMPATGTFAWATESASDESSAPPTVFLSPAAAIDNTLYVGVRQDRNHAVMALAAGDNLDKKPAIQWKVPTKLPVTISPAASEKCVYFVEGQTGDKDRSLRCVDRQTGAVRWTHAMADEAPGNFMVAHDSLLIADGGARLTCLDRDSGSERWHADSGRIVGTPAVAEGLIAVAIENPPSVIALDLQTHQSLWSRPLPSAPRTGAILVSDRVWVATADAVHGLSLVHGEKPLTVDASAAQLTTDGVRVACTTQSGTLLIINPQTGETLPPIADATPTIPPLLAGDSLLYYAKDSIRRFDLSSNQSTPWTKVQPSWLGTIRTPLMMVDSHVLFATDKRGLICMKPRKN